MLIIYKKSYLSSQSEYQRGVSTWNFNIEDLKEQAASVRLLCFLRNYCLPISLLIFYIFVCVKQLNDDDILVEDREEDDFYGEQLHNKASNRALVSPEDMNGKEKVSDTFSLTASPVEPATPSPKHGVPQAKAKSLREQTHESGGPQKGHVYARFAPLADCCCV